MERPRRGGRPAVGGGFDGGARGVDGGHVHAVLPDGLRHWEAYMRDDLLVAGEVYEAEPPPLAALANLQGDESGDAQLLLGQ